ncbi:ComEC family competence protein [Candidatus Aerophobetes bacterium]|uniref:ComEC family competence protein n=1 Tax=Aerophobetes bacterium TaxID=2030807 RepID=A0A523W501_UNCAE|nr:MAG: ComEC family competence protein [Candidatus Aerophobetes bacterium]
MKKPIVGLTLFFMAGIVLGRYLPFSFLPFYIFSLILFGASFSLFLKRKTPLVSLFLFSLTLLVGYLYFSFTYFPHSPAHIINFASSEGEVELVGRVVSRPSEKIFTKRKRVSFILETERIEPFRSNQERSSQISSPDVPDKENTLYGKVEGKVWVNSYSLYQNLGYGDRVRVRGKLRLPRSAREKGDFDWQRYLSYQGVWVELHTGWVEMLESSSISLMRWAHQNENHLARAIEKTLPNPHDQVAKGILLGDKERLPPHILTSFRRTGTAHVLVVSGLHVGLILFILFFVLRTLGVRSKIVAMLAFPVLVYYALLVGLRAPVVRASFMAGVGLTCLLINGIPR